MTGRARIIVGIDSGVSGAITFLARLDGELRLAVFDMPVLKIQKGKTTRQAVDGPAVVDLLERFRPAHAWLERAQAMPPDLHGRRQGIGSTATYMEGYGLLRGILVALRVPHDLVHPATWKKALRVPREKDDARARASQLMPRFADKWNLKKHHGRAESALIALYGETHMAPRVAPQDETS